MDRPAAKCFTELIVWQRAHSFVLKVYALSATFPRHETYGLTAQLRRAAVSIASNIAEGFRRRTPPEKARFMNIAEGSLQEARYYLILARDLSYGEDESLEDHADHVSRLLTAYTQALLRQAKSHG